MSAHADPIRPRGLVARVGGWAARRRRAVLIGWLVALVGVVAVSQSAGTDYRNSASLQGTDSQRAADLLERDFPAKSGDSDQVVFRARNGRMTDPAVRAQVGAVLARIAALPHVGGVVSPYASAAGQPISPDGTIAFGTVTFDERANAVPRAAARRVIAVAQAAQSRSLDVQLGGQAIEQAQQPSLGPATTVGLVAALVVLLVTFGSLLAAGLPIVTALLGLGIGLGLAGLATHLIGIPDWSTQLAAMIGLGVGIDYALFIITRFRESYQAGAATQTAIVDAMDTAGRAVLFAGLTVVVALLGQFALGFAFLNGLAVVSSLAVLTTMLAALTVLPALLSRFGHRVGRPSRRARAQASKGSDAREPGRWWARWAGLIRRRPWPAAIAGLAIMLALASPVLGLRLGSSDAGNGPASDTTRQAYDLLAEGFGAGTNGPLLVVAGLPRTSDAAAVARLSAVLRATPDVASVPPRQLSPNGRTAVFTVYPRSAPQAQATTDLVRTLRTRVLPPVADATGAAIFVGGAQATSIDFTDVMSGKIALFIAIVVALSALVLLVVFRSVVIPLQAAAMNLLSIGAAIGVSVAIFQWGWLGGLFGVEGGPIEVFIPVMLFSIVFGLSMDYEIFLVSRIHEEWTRRRDASQAVTHGLASTGRVITAAATIMICVFLSFAFGDQRVLKLFGLSLASAVFLDAFVVRSLLLPAVLEILGRRTWVLPSWLDRRLPRVSIEGRAVPAEA